MSELTADELRHQLDAAHNQIRELNMKLEVRAFNERLLQEQIHDDTNTQRFLREQLEEFERKEELQLQEYERRIRELENNQQWSAKTPDVEKVDVGSQTTPCKISDMGVQTCEEDDTTTIRPVTDSPKIDYKRIVCEEKAILKRSIDPCCGLLDLLVPNGVLLYEEYQKIVHSSTNAMVINDHLLTVLVTKDEPQFESFLKSLGDTEQGHIVGFFQNNGVIDPEGGDLRILTIEEAKRIDFNWHSLVELIVLNTVIDRLFQENCITATQKESIMAKKINKEKLRELLDHIRRGSFAGFKRFISCLRCDNHEHIADLLESGGVVLPGNAKIKKGSDQVHHTKTEIISEFRRSLKIIKKRQTQFPELTRENIRLLWVGNQRRCKIYFHCVPDEALKRLMEMVLSGELGEIIQKHINKLLKTTTITVSFTCNPHDYEQCKEYFERPIIDPWWPMVEAIQDNEPDTFKNQLTLTYVIKHSNLNAVSGITVFKSKLYVTRAVSDIMEEYDLTNGELLATTTITIGILYHSERPYYIPNPVDMAGCEIQEYIYICDAKNSCILRMRPPINDVTTKPWLVPGEPKGISVNKRGHVIVSCFKVGKLLELDKIGHLIREITLVESTIPFCPFHAIQISDDEWLVSYQSAAGNDITFGVGIVDDDGEMDCCYRDQRSLDLEVNDGGALSYPVHLAVDVCGRSIVADSNNNRIKLLSPSLEHVRDVLVPDRIQAPTTMVIYAKLGLLFVGSKLGSIVAYCITNKQ